MKPENTIKTTIFTSKTYTVKSSAVRAAKKQHATDYQIGNVLIEETATGFVYNVQADVQSEAKTTRRNGSCERIIKIAETMHSSGTKPRRCEVIEACVREGINIHTARTQYQRWLKPLVKKLKI